MTLTTHAAIGMLAAQWVGDPTWGFVLAFVSHFIADAIPHGDEYIYWRLVHNPKDPYGRRLAFTDATALLLLVLTVLSFRQNANNALILAGALGGILPDLIMTLETTVRVRHKEEHDQRRKGLLEWAVWLLRPHQWLHRVAHDMVRTPIRYTTGLAYQAVFITLFIFYFVQ